MEWIRLTDYAKRYHVTSSAIYSALSAGRLRDNGKRGNLRRVDGGTDIRQPRTAARDDLALKMAEAKLLKLQGEGRILEQRSERFQRMMIEETAEKFLRAFEAAFTPFRGELTKLKLPADRLAVLMASLDEGLARFEAALEEALKDEENDSR